MRSTALIPLLVLICLVGCTAVDGASTESSVRVASRFIYRGVPQVNRPVLQARIGASVPDSYGNRWAAGLWANANGESDTGAGVFPDGKGGEVSRYDFSGSVTREVPGGELELSYERLFVRGDSSPIGDTTELAIAYSMPDWAWHPRFSFAYEFGDVDGFYASYETSHPVAVEEAWSAELWGHVGLVGGAYAFQYFGEHSGGFSDVVFGPRFAVPLRGGAVLRGSVLMNYTVEEAYRKSLRAAGFAPNHLVASIGVDWSL